PEADRPRDTPGLSAEPAIKRRVYHTVRKQLDALGNLLFKGNAPREQLTLLFLDSQTLVFADAGPMKKFLEDDCKPEPRSKAPEPAPQQPAPNQPRDTPHPQ